MKSTTFHCSKSAPVRRPQRSRRLVAGLAAGCRVLAAAAGPTLTATVAQAQTTWYVDDDAPNDPGPGDPTVSDPAEDGSADHPFDEIQDGIDAAVAANGDEVLVLDGTYTGPGNKDLDFGGKAITARGAGGPDNCIIDCEVSAPDPHRGFYVHWRARGPAVELGVKVNPENPREWVLTMGGRTS